MENIKISKLLLGGFTLLILFVIGLGSISYLQTSELQSQTEKLFLHPLTVQKAIGELKTDVLMIRNKMLNLFPSPTADEIEHTIVSIEFYRQHGEEQIGILKKQYLGPPADIDTIKKRFTYWNNLRSETFRLAREGENEKAHERRKETGVAGQAHFRLLESINVVDRFAAEKAASFLKASFDLRNLLHRQLLTIVAAILVLSMIVMTILIGQIRKPLNILTEAARKFKNGDLEARSSFRAGNEFGALSDSFNELAAGIQANMELNRKISGFSTLMLTHDNPTLFFNKTLDALCQYTGSQMAAVYTRSQDEKNYEYLMSVGMESGLKPSFSASGNEGEFGLALLRREIQVIRNISKETLFEFHTVSGKFVPAEMVTIPVIASHDIVAVISLATLNSYGDNDIKFLHEIFITLCARVAGILAFKKMKEYSVHIEKQNQELEIQKNELTSQTAEMQIQNRELELQKQQLDEASRLKTSFLSNMSHELRTPLNSVIALAGVLNRRMKGRIPDEEFSYLNVIERNGKHLLALINDILDISRIEAGREEFETMRFDMNELVAEVIAMIAPQAEQKGIGIRQVPSQQEAMADTDMEKCRHILQNLISNAVKFTEKGNVVVEVTGKKGFLDVSVTDTGIGISPDHLPHIFDEFRQGDGSTSRRYGGTGLGLAIAKKYASLLGGSISVSSVPGKGSEFVLTLPVHYFSLRNPDETGKEPGIAEASFADPKKAPVANVNAPPYKNQLSGTILLVEDSEPAVIQIRDILEEKGYTITVADNGSGALTYLETMLPDAIILDLMMPGVDGFQVLKTLREDDRTALIPVLILTAKHITRDELRFLKRNNVHQLIRKGDVNRADLIRAIENMLNPPAQPKQLPRSPAPGQLRTPPLVLVVEDNPDNMITVKALLSEKFDVIEATDGKQGVEVTAMHYPDLVLMDIALPEMTGIEAFRLIRNNRALSHIPIIALTASAMISDRESILAHGFDAYIAKPIEEREFFNTIQQVLFGSH